ncbi:hypothetical protein [Candidatus Nanohalococcus occultus]|uniref:hypothetical protein n=1 Tax=Candidatus Nanohalococcus occultus TaxID=2978047 RepID=UPI0039E18D6D
MGVFDELVRMMMDMGVFQVIFPWLIVMSVTYGALSKYEYFEDDMVNGAIALSLGFLTSAGMVMFVPEGLFTNFMAALAFVAVGLIGIIVLAAIGGIDFSEIDREDNPIGGIAIGFSLIALVLVFLYQYDITGLIPQTSGSVWEDAVMPVLTMIFIIILVAVTAGGGGDDE